jgi:hypothetical protein
LAAALIAAALAVVAAAAVPAFRPVGHHRAAMY